MASTTRCTTYIHTDEGVRQCSRAATHCLPARPEVASCTQHARVYDVPMAGQGR